MKLASFVFGVIFILCGILILCNQINVFLGKAKKSKEEINSPKFKSFTRNVGTLITIGGIILAVNGIWTYYAEHVFIWVFLAWLILGIGDVAFILNKHPKNKNKKGGKSNEKETN